jgi:hypothetical protein
MTDGGLNYCFSCVTSATGHNARLSGPIAMPKGRSMRLSRRAHYPRVGGFGATVPTAARSNCSVIEAIEWGAA